jgi:GGDEF domain-containing protein
MRVFDRIDPHDLKKREWHLWLLVLATLAVFAGAIGLLMYPTVFLNPFVGGIELRKVFFSFCVLSALLLAYLSNRQVVLMRTRDKVFKDQQAKLEAQRELAACLLGSLPDLPLFQARLRAEFQRAALGAQPFSVILGSVKALADSSSADSQLIAMILGALKRRLRRDDLIYLLAPRVFSILLPGVTHENGECIRERMSRAFGEAHAASGASFEMKLLSYPEQTNSLPSFEEAVISFAGVSPPPGGGRASGKTGPQQVGWIKRAS